MIPILPVSHRLHESKRSVSELWLLQVSLQIHRYGYWFSGSIQAMCSKGDFFYQSFPHRYEQSLEAQLMRRNAQTQNLK